MKLLHYIFHNKLSIRWWMRRCAVTVFGLSIIWLIVWSVWVNQWLTTDRVSSLLSRPEVTQQIDTISDFLSGDQYIQISEASGFVTNKTGVRMQSSDSIIEVKLDGSCEDWFSTNSKKWALLTNRSICIRDTSKQQVVTRAQIMSGVSNATGMQDAEISGFIARYPSLGQMMSGGVVMITSATLQQIETDIKTITQDPQVMDAMLDWVSTVAMMMLIPLWLMAIFFTIVMTIILFVWLVIYSLIARAIAGIMSYDISFEEAFSLSRLPWIVVKVWWSLAWLDWAPRVILWIIIIASMIYYHKQSQHDTKSE